MIREFVFATKKLSLIFMKSKIYNKKIFECFDYQQMIPIKSSLQLYSINSEYIGVVYVCLCASNNGEEENTNKVNCSTTFLRNEVRNYSRQCSKRKIIDKEFDLITKFCWSILTRT